jgi:hypothetical protein
MAFPPGFNPLWAQPLADGTPGPGPSLDELKSFRLTESDARKLTPDEAALVRYLCLTSLRFLVNSVLRPASQKFLPFTEKCHGRIFDSFLRPIPGKTYDQWSDVKERATLAFRGATKSTIVGGFLTQVVLTDRDIRILILSGKLPHAKTIMALARQPFFTNGVVRCLFPEWAIELDQVSGDSFTCPCRTAELNLRDPTLGIATFDSVKAGGHYELLVFDDCTNEINCATPELVDKNEQHYDDTEGLIEPGGYRHFFGTTWAPVETDLPQIIRQRGEAYAAEHKGERNTEYSETPVWTLRTDGTPEEQADRLERDRKNTLHPEDVILTWPEKLTVKFLWPKYRANPQKFNGQYLLRWRGMYLTESFTMDLLMRNTRPFAEGMPLPHDRFMVINWDMGGIYTGRRAKKGFDFSCGIAGMFELSTRRLFCYDAFLEVFVSSTDAATAIVQFYERQLKIGPVGICRIEDSFGVRMLEGELNSVAKKLKVPLQIVWDPPENTDNSKNIAITMAAGAMKKGLIQFSNSMPYRDEIFKMFVNWSPQPGLRRKDDGPDNIAQIWKCYNGQIFPNQVGIMQASSNEFSFAPEIPEEVDLHADERLYADFGLLQRMTVDHAS